MSELPIKEKLRIANSGGYFQETSSSSWVGTKIRKGDKLGVVTQDLNGAYRRLKVRFEDGTEDEIQMNNIGPDPEYVHEFEWYCECPNSPIDKTWVRF
jgi:hypothetical protein